MASLAGHVARDDELLGRPDLELEPRSRAVAGLVAAPPMLRHRSLEALRSSRREERDAVALHVAAESDARVVAEDEPQDGLAIFERHVEVRPARAPWEVEGHEDEGRGPARLARGTARGEVRGAEAAPEARLEQAEVGAALGVQRDDLAVDDRLRRCEPGRLREQLGE